MVRGSSSSSLVLDVGQQLLDSHEACQATRTCSGGWSRAHAEQGGSQAKCEISAMLFECRLADATMPVGPVEVIGQPSMAAEDFSFYGQRVPSVFTFLGIGEETENLIFVSAQASKRGHKEFMLFSEKLDGGGGCMGLQEVQLRSLFHHEQQLGRH
eukprot:1161414-Pelagomonas_calceolata.AAC.4